MQEKEGKKSRAAAVMIKFERTEIYNRWGQKLFDSKENGYYWNGQTNGEKQVPDGTYYYIITTEKEIYTGFLQLLR